MRSAAVWIALLVALAGAGAQRDPGTAETDKPVKLTPAVKGALARTPEELKASAFHGLTEAQVEQVSSVTAALQGGQLEYAMTEWMTFLASAEKHDTPINMAAIIQQALQESYVENNSDLYFYAAQVRFFNKLKKTTRAELSRLREVQASLAPVSSEDEDSWADVSATVPEVDLDADPPTLSLTKRPVRSRGELRQSIRDVRTVLSTVGAAQDEFEAGEGRRALARQRRTLREMVELAKALRHAAEEEDDDRD